jgi:hypothetical protein
MNAITTCDYIEDNFNCQDRLAVVLKYRGQDGLVQRISSAEKIAAPAFQAWLTYENARGWNVYLGMNALRPDALQRTKDNVAVVRHIYLDLDEDGPESLARILKDPHLPMPSYVLNTSPGKHQVIWKAEGFLPDRAEKLQRTLAVIYGADRASTDCARVMRIPGFDNWKYATPYRVTADRLPGGICKPADFRINVDLLPGRNLRSRSTIQEAPHAGVQHFSQSERDWADTLCRLSRGEDPAAVRAALEQKRQDKDDPKYYADRTVTRALAELSRRRTNAAERGLEL